jgi:hypothetical protein
MMKMKKGKFLKFHKILTWPSQILFFEKKKNSIFLQFQLFSTRNIISVEAAKVLYFWHNILAIVV